MVYVLFLCASMNFAYQPCEVHACHQTNSPLGFSVNFTSTVALYLPTLSIHACTFWMSIHRFPWRYRSIIRTYCKYVHVHDLWLGIAQICSQFVYLCWILSNTWYSCTPICRSTFACVQTAYEYTFLGREFGKFQPLMLKTIGSVYTQLKPVILGKSFTEL